MKVIADYPVGLFHPCQAKFKKARLRDDAVILFAEDPRWQHYDQYSRLACNKFLTEFAGKDCVVHRTFYTEGSLMYGVEFQFRISIMHPDGTRVSECRCQFPADYFEIPGGLKDMGYVEAS